MGLPIPSLSFLSRMNIRIATRPTQNILGKIARKRHTGCKPLFAMVASHKVSGQHEETIRKHGFLISL
jgi:hypothetical protein